MMFYFNCTSARIQQRLFHNSYAGEALVVLSALLYSTMGLFVKVIDTNVWNIIFWRGLFTSVFITLWVVSRKTSFCTAISSIGYSGLAVAIVGALGTAAYIPAFSLTSIANVSLIYATAPLVAAAIAWLTMREQTSMATLFCCVAALFGAGVIVLGSLGGVSLWGDLLAAWMTICMAIIMVIYRNYPQTPSAEPQILQSLLILPFAATMSNPLNIPVQAIAALVVFSVVFAIASILMAEGAKRVSVSRTALLSTIETPLAPLLALVVLAETPDLATLLGGAVIVSVVLYSLLQVHQ